METRNFIQLFGEAVRAVRADSWANLLTGLGTDRDKRTATTFAAGPVLSDELLEQLYNDNDMAARIVEALPEESLRKGFSVKITDEDNPENASETEDDVQAALDELNTLEKFAEAYIWGRLYGGAGILVGADDGASVERLTEPLNEDRIKSIKYLNVIDKKSLDPGEYYTDPTQEKFGEPKIYEITNDTLGEQSASIFVHESRLIIFDGVRTTKTTKDQNNGWNLSVLQRVHEVLQDFGVGWQAVSHLLTDASQGVWKMKGLIEAIATAKDGDISSRMAVVDKNRSVARMILVDKDGEEFERHTVNFGSVDKILQMFILRLSAAAKMPATKLMGQSPAGMNATGDGDFQNWYGEIVSAQKNYLTPRLKRLIELVTLAKDGPTSGVVPETWNIVFEDPWVLTPLETADLKLKTAQTDEINITTGVVLPEEVTLSRFRPDGFSTETTVDVEFRKLVLENETERAIENSENPPTQNLPDPNADPLQADEENASGNVLPPNADSRGDSGEVQGSFGVQFDLYEPTSNPDQPPTQDGPYTGGDGGSDTGSEGD
ncbi:MAG: anti-CBASS protein Acb1 family protein [Planctomycetota bacterium]|jgi:phage-related protein (TIGR01555 family)